MRLGGFFGAPTIVDLEPLCEQLDTHGLSAIGAPGGLTEMTADECLAYGARARELGIVIGEAGMWDNLLTDDESLRAQRIERVRALLRNADIMGCHCVVTLVGSKHASGSALAPHPYSADRQGVLDSLQQALNRHWSFHRFYDHLRVLEPFGCPMPIGFRRLSFLALLITIGSVGAVVGVHMNRVDHHRQYEELMFEGLDRLVSGDPSMAGEPFRRAAELETLRASPRLYLAHALAADLRTTDSAVSSASR